ncbi:hypothetical protein GN956_G11603 [Arapaima gigas]
MLTPACALFPGPYGRGVLLHFRETRVIFRRGSEGGADHSSPGPTLSSRTDADRLSDPVTDNQLLVMNE